MAVPSGIQGRVRNANTGDPIATANSVYLTKQTAAVLIPNFESPQDDDGMVWPEVLPGISTGSLAIEGQFDTDPAAPTDGPVVGLSNGMYVALDLFLNRDQPWGVPGIVGMVSNFKLGTRVENQPATFTCEITTSGIVARSGVVE